MVNREIVPGWGIFKHAQETIQPFLPSFVGNAERHVPGTHAWRTVSLLIERRTTEQPDKESGRFTTGLTCPAEQVAN